MFVQRILVLRQMLQVAMVVDADATVVVVVVDDGVVVAVAMATRTQVTVVVTEVVEETGGKWTPLFAPSHLHIVPLRHPTFIASFHRHTSPPSSVTMHRFTSPSQGTVLT